MKKILFSALSLVIILLISSFAASRSSRPQADGIYSFEFNTLEGKKASLAQFKGKKMLIVNVASKCGYTPQYKNLQALHEKYKDKVIVIAFPANNFGSQEPGSAGEIREFCSKNYGVTFPVMEKISVKGEDMHPLYRYLSDKSRNGVTDQAPGWNFCKYLVDENGKILKFFGSKVDPLSEEITSLL